MKIRDALVNFCSDLLTCKEYEWFLPYVFRNEKGVWLQITQVFHTTNHLLPKRIAERDELFVVWLDTPHQNPEFIIMLFYDTELLWDMMASYNRQLFENNLA
jgi:hypothetical protein